MTATINASTSSGIIQTADTSGELALQSNGITQLTVSSTGVTFPTINAAGYGSGAGGTVVQATSKSTTITLNKPTGQITMNNAALASAAEVVFTVLNSVCGVNDTVVVNTTNTFNYTATCQGTGVGAFAIRIKNQTGGSLSEAVLVNFAIIKGATA